jgi:putative radical SAM enzyme (TIGR03279 family)
MPKMYGWVREVVPESLADQAGVMPGDLLRTVNGHLVRDLVDFQFYAADEELMLGIERHERPLQVLLARAQGEELGIIFGEEPAPYIRICANKCVFCFVKGLPERHSAQRGLPLGMRESLYIKDDDYRYSFLFGGFITLTNLKEADWERLEEQRLSPLFVSVHTTNPELRRKMVDGPRSGEVIDHLKRLGSIGISCHTQLVICPGMNDGEEIDRSLRDLAALRPTVESVSVVPVGLTKFNNMVRAQGLPTLRQHTVAEARAVVERVRGWQERFAAERGSHGLPFAYLSDEWYYLTGEPFPPARHYGSYAQIENGVGMTRKLLNDWQRERRAITPATHPQRVAFITGTMAQPVIEGLARDLGKRTGHDVRVVTVTNGFFGPLVTVAGLLCGQDVLDAIAERCADMTENDLILMPRVMLDVAGKRFLDDITVEQLRERVQPRVVFTRTAADVFAAIGSQADMPAGVA